MTYTIVRGIGLATDTMLADFGGGDTGTVTGKNGYCVGARVTSADLTSTWNFAIRNNNAPLAPFYTDTASTTIDRSYNRTHFRIPVTDSDSLTWALTAASDGETGAIKLYYDLSGSLGTGINKQTVAIAEADAGDGSDTGTITLATTTPAINGSLVGYYIDSTVSMGTSYTFTLYDGTDTTGPVLIADTSGTLERSADRTTIDIPVHQSDSLHWVFASISSNGTGTLALFFDLSG